MKTETLRAASERTGLTTHTLYRLVRTQQIAAIRITARGRHRIVCESLDRWLQERLTPAKEPQPQVTVDADRDLPTMDRDTSFLFG